MNKLLFSLALCIIFSSCSTYYVSKLNSLDLSKDEETGTFTFENDSIQISYNFFGENAPITINVFNKLNEPLYIDWQRSALIVGDQATSYLGDNLEINGNSTSSGASYPTFYDWRGSTSSGSFSGTAKIPRGLTFIPPKAKVTKTQLKLANLFYENIADSSYQAVELATFDGSTQRIKIRNYTANNTPLSFRSYLTFYLLNQDTQEAKDIVFEQHFYVNQVSKLTIDPSNMLIYKNKRGDVFFNKQTKGKNAAIIAAVVAVGAAAYAADEKNARQTFSRD